MLNLDKFIRVMKGNSTIEIVSQFLKDNNAHHAANTWEILQKRIEIALEEKHITEKKLLNFYDKTEESGRQKIYFFQYDCSKLADLFKKIKEQINNDERLSNMCNKIIILDIPSKITLTSIALNENIFKLKWVEKKTFTEEDKDFIRDIDIDSLDDGETFQRNYIVRQARCVSIFKMDLKTGQIQIKIQRVQKRIYDSKRAYNQHYSSNEYYQDMLNFCITEAKNFIDISLLRRVNLDLIKIFDFPEDEFRFKRKDINTETDVKANFISAGRQYDLRHDFIYNLLDENRDKFNLNEIITIWQSGKNLHLSKEIATIINKTEVIIREKCSWEDLENVLSKIRKLSIIVE